MADENAMKKLKDALAVGKKVEIARHAGAASSSFGIAGDNADRASKANARGERVVRIIGEDGERDYECSATADQVVELVEAGATEL